MWETIGDYRYPDVEQSSMPRHPRDLRKNSAMFWRELVRSTGREYESLQFNSRGLPLDPGRAYQMLFACGLPNKMFEPVRPPKAKPSLLEGLQQQRNAPLKEQPQEDCRRLGDRFLRGFLRYVIDPGCEAGHGSTGRRELNAAHIYLAALLELQQCGRIGPFCRTILTTNFDTLLQNALQMVNILYYLTDRPEEYCVFQEEETAIHLVYVHGSILRHNPANSTYEIGELAKRNSDRIHEYLQIRDIVAVGYSGWEDCLMSSLRRLPSGQQNLYWCDVLPEPPDTAAAVLKAWGHRGFYVNLGKDGADSLLKSLYDGIVGSEAGRDLWERYRVWRSLPSLVRKEAE